MTAFFYIVIFLWIDIIMQFWALELGRRVRSANEVRPTDQVTPKQVFDSAKPYKLEKILNNIVFSDEEANTQYKILEGIENFAFPSNDCSTVAPNGLFLSFRFPTIKAQQDAVLGILPNYVRILAHSRIKRWWMAPSFHTNADTIPVETQLLLLELSTLSSTAFSPLSNMLQKMPTLSSLQPFPHKKYALIAPLIDFNRGFRMTLYGAEGGAPAGNKKLALRLESGDENIKTNIVDNALYLACGDDPYSLISQSYDMIAQQMGTFRTRQNKLIPAGIDSFGFCTWDAFYSKVSSEKVLAGVESLSAIGFPPRFVIIDDGWQSTSQMARVQSSRSGSVSSGIINSVPSGSSAVGSNSVNNTLSSISSENSLAIGLSVRQIIGTKDEEIDGGDDSRDLPIHLVPIQQQLLLPSSSSSSTFSQTTKLISNSNSSSSTALSTVPDALVGTPISGSSASQEMVKEDDSCVLKLSIFLISKFYSEYVEKGKPDSWAVRLWVFLSRTILKQKLISFFDGQTDFSKRLVSWTANSKFENPAEGRTLRGLVTTLKEEKGVNFVYVWHALSGYWGGVSEDENDEVPRELNGHDNFFLNQLSNFNLTYYVSTATKTIQDLYQKSILNSTIGLYTYNPFSHMFNGTTRKPFAYRQPFPNKNSLSGFDSAKSAIALVKEKKVRRSYSKPTPHLLLVEPSLAWDPSSLVGVGSVALDKLEEMYFRMYSYLAEAGIDGVKVDAQSGIGSFGSGNGGGSNLARATVSAMEKNVRYFFGNPSVQSLLSNATASRINNSLTSFAASLKSLTSSSSSGRHSRGLSLYPMLRKIRNKIFYYSGTSGSGKNAQESGYVPHSLNDDSHSLSPVSLVGCMCHSTENLLNFYETSLARVSDDFYPKDFPSQSVHLASCAYNSVMIGEIAIADWDMFHSRHPASEMHAAARAISGGPVYVSDSPGNHNSSILKRLVLPNGRILRTLLPARPTVDTLFRDVMRDGKSALKIWSLNKMNAVVGVFNVQGASWDKNLRKYVQHDILNLAQYNTPIEVSVAARDINGNFSLSTSQSFLVEAKRNFGSSSSRSPKNSRNSEIEIDARRVSPLFLAWSSNEQKLHFLSSRNSVVKKYLKPRECDIITIHHMYSITIKDLQKFVRNPGAPNNSKGDCLNEPTITHQDPFRQFQDTLKGIFTPILNIPIDNTVYWTPLGLVAMYNGGGAVDDVEINSPKVSRSTSSFSTRGPGKFGLFANILPKKIVVDKKYTFVATDFDDSDEVADVGKPSNNGQATIRNNIKTSDNNGTLVYHHKRQEFGGYLITLTIPPQGSASRLPLPPSFSLALALSWQMENLATWMPSSLVTTAKILKNETYQDNILNDQLRNLVIQWV